MAIYTKHKKHKTQNENNTHMYHHNRNVLYFQMLQLIFEILLLHSNYSYCIVTSRET